jgi:hypothetical protein
LIDQLIAIGSLARQIRMPDIPRDVEVLMPYGQKMMGVNNLLLYWGIDVPGRS